ncbi:DNA-directed RNA polymerase II subunit RPB9 (RNA polymerase II subunit B9) (DNA-directed RNA polymerase II subunit I) [Durusdinium trenchii]|uniref:DNA-directed RNA polymerase II subunit RPB9 (RNA polymerase II subunit B9) (DNA-directed RNA polymerase II subunit I) n=1 Tax=Durusdinium trenchii TaxID=1381693 RepID=A0ABP0QBQ2_9DINO
MASYKSTLRFCTEPREFSTGPRTVTCERCLFGFPTLGVPKDLEKRSVLMQESIIVMPDVIHDPTLPRVYDYDCHVCGHNQAVYYRLSETIVSDAMAIIYVCCECSNWRTEGKEVWSPVSTQGADGPMAHSLETDGQ